jgi:WD40-like Beta Propeller Repeat
MRRAWLSLGLASAILVALGAFGCGNQPPATAGERNLEILDALPVYPGALTAETVTERGGPDGPDIKLTSRNFELPDGGRIAPIEAFYRRELAARGWAADRGPETTIYHKGRAFLVVGLKSAVGGRPPLITLMVASEGYEENAAADTGPANPPEAPPPAPPSTAPPGAIPVAPRRTVPDVPGRVTPEPEPACSPRAAVPEGRLTTLTLNRRIVLVPLEGDGACTLTTLPDTVGEVADMDVTPNGERIFLSAVEEGEHRIFSLVVATAEITEVAGDAAGPTVSPDGRTLAYTEIAPGLAIDYRRAVALRDLSSGAGRRIAYPAWEVRVEPRSAMGWSPDGTRLALPWDGLRTLGVDAERMASSREVPGTRAGRNETPPLSPAFLDDTTLVAYGGCCIGPGKLLAIEASTGRQSTLTAVEAPLRSIDVRHATRQVALVTELLNLFVWDGRALRRVRTGVSLAAW